jgi:N-acetylglutamate synthase
VGQRVVVRHRLPDGSATDVLGELVRADAESLRVRTRHGDVEVPLATVVAGKVVPPRPVRAARPHLAVSIADLERTAAAHWRPPDSHALGEWLLRACGGFTGRANSCLLVGDPGRPPAQALAEVCEWYRSRGLRAWVCLPSAVPGGVPADAPEHLAEQLRPAGWRERTGAGALVYTAAVEAVVAGGSAVAARALAPGLRVQRTDRPDEGWLGGFHYHGAPVPAEGLELLVSAPEQVFVSFLDGATTVAVARGSLGGGWAALTAVEVDPAYRRGGLGTRLLGMVAEWAADRGVRSIVLQVHVGNGPAQRIYAAAGFAVHHRYDYWELPR